MQYTNFAQTYMEERESVDHCLDRLLETIRGELEKGSPDDYKKLITKRRRRERKQAKA
ncbi:MAG: hypothetical protein IJI71_01935 [Clostridia bacterium]|nr:hypothetical protein [Clostridia bacterium]